MDRLTDPLTVYLIGGGAMSPEAGGFWLLTELRSVMSSDCVRLLEGPVSLSVVARSQGRDEGYRPRRL
ncbi:hypothetical protein MW046_19330 (plasmid) [Halocatena salina]|uniref:Uncharacterized protein n=1 Tax=Halocatena salina TaxID=2934340 RepID=A0A8U0A8X2_9EURY|nr:hypothetical protein [Halocatena salina]UPM45299.1 hypothetical protein MW046_19330 [Halocatena salina]